MSNPRPTSKPPRIGRKRRTLGWTLLTLGLLVAGVWVASYRFAFGYAGQKVSVGCGRGSFAMSRVQQNSQTGWQWLELPAQMREIRWQPRLLEEFGIDIDLWLVARARRTTQWGPMWFFEAVLWPVPILLWTPAALFLRSGIIARRRADTGKCFKCGYDLAGLATGSPCPECGKGP